MGTVAAILLWASLAPTVDTRIVEFGQPNCPNCRQMDSVVRRLQAAGYTVERVNAVEQPELAQQFGVTGTPTYVVFVDGQPVQRAAGAMSFDKLAELAGPRPTAAPPNPLRATPTSESAATPSPPTPPQPTRQPAAEPAADAMESRTAAPPPPAAALPSAPRSAGSETIQPAAEQRAMQATVRLRVTDDAGTSVATGTIVDVHDGQALIVTCAHVFRASRGKGQIQVDLFVPGAGAPLVGELIDFDFYRDVAVVSIQPKLAVRPAPIASLDQAGEASSAVFSIGCNNGGQPSIERSRITRINRYKGPPNVEVSGAPAGGRSGGGLFSADGALIGVCNASNEPENEGIYAALATVHWQLDQVGLARLIPPAGTAGAKSETAVADAAPRPAATGAEAGAAELMPSSDQIVTVHVRSKSRPQDPGQTFVLERPSPQLLQQLAQGARPADAGPGMGPGAGNVNALAGPTLGSPSAMPPLPPTAPPPPAAPPPTAAIPGAIRDPLAAQPSPTQPRLGGPLPEAKAPVMRGQQPSGGIWPFRR
ncbi:MAG: trypsin-like peptidase domain-containing protein [Pirellulales bacterium]